MEVEIPHRTRILHLTTASVKLQINRFAEENALLVVDNRNDEITPFNLNPKGSSVLIEKRNGKIYIEETESTRN